MHVEIRLRRRHVLALVGALLVAAAAGAAYASIPDANGVYTACKLNATGTIRLIDPSGPSTSRLSHCTSLETQITWNQQGQRGADGVSPTVAQLQAGDSHCPAGGASITDATGATAYVCSAGQLTSPNGAFAVAVGDGGVQITGPGTSISLASDGTVHISGDRIETVSNDETTTVNHDRSETVGGSETIKVGGDRSQSVGGSETISVGGDRSETVSKNETITVGGNRTETVGADEEITVGGSRSEKAAGTLTFGGSLVTVNGGSNCLPAARKGDLIDPVAELITSGSPTVCIG